MSEMSHQSRLAFLQEAATRIGTETQPPDHHHLIEQSVTNLLHTCGKSVVRPLPGQDMQEIRGQDAAKRALEVAAAGAHHLLLIGPPGAGKTLLARTLPSILPRTAVPYPFRVLNASLDVAALVGDGTTPGALTRAHGGVLFIENLGRFPRSLLAPLQQAVESHAITVSHGEEKNVFATRFLLVATMTPCPCGFFNDPMRECRCSAEEIIEYQERIKEMVDACFDIHVDVPRRGEALLRRHPEECSADIRARIEHARMVQHRRYAERSSLWVNADLASADDIHHFCALSSSSEKLLNDAIGQLNVAPSKIVRLLCLARTIADLSASEIIEVHHLVEAIHDRSRL